MQVRPVRAEEHRRAGEVVVAAYRALPGSRLGGDYADQLADVDRRAREAEVLVAVDGGEVVGCVTFVPGKASPWAEGLEDGEAGIRMLGVDPAGQGRGAGQLLVGTCIERSVAGGCEGLFLHTTPWMTAAHRLYERNGFVRVAERDWPASPQLRLLAYRLDLSTMRH
jgi:ribosomal protein S18 acetylase RimI-like enzyme